MSLIMLFGDLSANARCDVEHPCPSGEACYLGTCNYTKIEYELRPPHKKINSSIHNSSDEKKN